MRAMTLVFAMAMVCPALAQDDPRDVTRNYAIEKVADGIYAFIAPEPRSGVVNGNTTVIIGDSGVVVVDPGQFPTLARRHIAEIRKLTDKPVRAVVNTHWHWDHNLANSVYRSAFPGVSIISTEFTREYIEKFTPGFLERMGKNGPAILERLKTTLASGKRSDGTPLTDDQKAELTEIVRDFGYGIPQLQQAVLDAPDVTFRDAITLRLGARTVEIRWPGRANTAGDAVVWVPDAKTLVTGDLVVFPTPYATSAYPAEWATALKKLLELQPAAIVPGHGPVERDTKYAKLVADTLQSIADSAASAAREGLTLEQTKAKLNLDTARAQFAGTDPLRRKAFDEYFATAVIDNAYKQAKGEKTEEAPF